MTAYLVRAHKHGVEPPGDYADREQLMLEKGVVIMPFDQVPDLSDVLDDEDRMKRRFAVTYHWEPKPNTTDYWMWQMWHFIHQMGIKDLVVLPFYPFNDKAAVGEVTGPYQYRTDLTESGLHTRPVKWLCKEIPIGEFADIVRESLEKAVMDFCRIAGETPLEVRAKIEPHIREVVAKWLAEREAGS